AGRLQRQTHGLGGRIERDDRDDVEIVRGVHLVVHALRECLSVGDVGAARTGGRVRSAHGRVLAELVSVDTGLRLQTAGVRRVVDPDPVLDGRAGIVHVLTFLVTGVAGPTTAAS